MFSTKLGMMGKDVPTASLGETMFYAFTVALRSVAPPLTHALSSPPPRPFLSPSLEPEGEMQMHSGLQVWRTQ